MPEILTESFCERCGTRYTFESAAPTKAKKLGRFKTLSKGLKNYVLSDDNVAGRGHGGGPQRRRARADVVSSSTPSTRPSTSA